jgi:hypothetical protein
MRRQYLDAIKRTDHPVDVRCRMEGEAEIRSRTLSELHDKLPTIERCAFTPTHGVHEPRARNGKQEESARPHDPLEFRHPRKAEFGRQMRKDRNGVYESEMCIGIGQRRRKLVMVRSHEREIRSHPADQLGIMIGAVDVYAPVAWPVSRDTTAATSKIKDAS